MSEEKKSPGRPANRPKRKPIAGRNKLTAPTREGYVRRFVSDEGDRVKMFQDAGYEVVTGNIQTSEQSLDPKQIGSNVTADGGNGVKLVLMEIDERYYKEDQDKKNQDIDEREKALFREQNERPGHYGSVTRSMS